MEAFMDGSTTGRSRWECATDVECVVIERLKDVQWLIESFRATADYADCDGAARFADVLGLAVEDCRSAASGVAEALREGEGQ